MVIVTSSGVKYNEKEETWGVSDGDPAPICPLCKCKLKYRDRRRRNLRNGSGNMRRLALRRFWCPACKHYHTELPDIIQPYKHYDSETIQSVIDNGAGDCGADDSTIRRWKGDFAEAGPDIEQHLRSVQAIETDEHVPIASGTKILTGIRRSVKRWLAHVMKLLINAGHKICTRFAFCPQSVPGKVAGDGSSAGKGDGFHDKTKEDTG